MPKTVNDLNKHKFISFGKGAPSPVYNPDWALKIGMHDGKKRKSIMKVIDSFEYENTNCLFEKDDTVKIKTLGIGDTGFKLKEWCKRIFKRYWCC